MGLDESSAGDLNAGSVAKLALRRSFGGSSAGSVVGSGLGDASFFGWISSVEAGGSVSSAPQSSSPEINKI